MKLQAYAPAGIGNFAAGFDLMGASVAPLDGSLWGDVVEAEAAAATRLTVGGAYASGLPEDPERNLVLRTFALFREALREKDLDCPEITFRLDKNLPLCSGLGSSASSVAATLAACQALLGEPLSRAELYTVAGRAEALASGSVHLDNVVPALVGGLQLLVPGPDGAAESRSLPWPDDLVLVVVSPAFALATERSRQVLPSCFTLAETLAFAENLAGFVHALETGDRPLLRRCLRDVLAEPHRAPLVPGFHAAQAAALRSGALGCTLSGSGPAIFAVAESPQHGDEVAAAVQAALLEAGLRSQTRLCGLDRQGARILP
ncbi:MAG TPA: homoserine kinase [Thermoanaerobaculia bacterium]|jgi:homoserine kinase|nr:homoserine kinase [Thermoanaerobaculia bacterium]